MFMMLANPFLPLAVAFAVVAFGAGALRLLLVFAVCLGAVNAAADAVDFLAGILRRAEELVVVTGGTAGFTTAGAGTGDDPVCRRVVGRW